MRGGRGTVSERVTIRLSLPTRARAVRAITVSRRSKTLSAPGLAADSVASDAGDTCQVTCDVTGAPSVSSSCTSTVLFRSTRPLTTMLAARGVGGGGGGGGDFGAVAWLEPQELSPIAAAAIHRPVPRLPANLCSARTPTARVVRRQPARYSPWCSQFRARLRCYHPSSTSRRFRSGRNCARIPPSTR